MLEACRPFVVLINDDDDDDDDDDDKSSAFSYAEGAELRVVSVCRTEHRIMMFAPSGYAGNLVQVLLDQISCGSFQRINYSEGFNRSSV